MSRNRAVIAVLLAAVCGAGVFLPLGIFIGDATHRDRPAPPAPAVTATIPPPSRCDPAGFRVWDGTGAYPDPSCRQDKP